MDPLAPLREAVKALNPVELETQKQHLLSLVETITRPAPFTAATAPRAQQPLRLARREAEVLTMILEGRRLKEIGHLLGISVKTVTTHRSRLLKKLGLQDNYGLFRYGVRNGLIQV